MTLLGRLIEERDMALLNERHGLYSRRRPPLLRAVGVVLHPPAVTDAWYAADCPRRLAWRQGGVSVATWLLWRVACFVRGAG